MKNKIILLIFLILLPIRVLAANSTSDTVSLSNCVDGNSARFMLGLGEVKVRFLGIEVEEKIKDDETDEINESLVSDYVCSSLKSAKKIKIEYEPNTSKEDKLGRIQAWVFLDDVLLQEDLVKLGYAKVMYIDDNYLYSDKLKDAQNSAKQMKLGIWKDYVEEINNDKDEKPVEEEKKKSKGIIGSIIDFIVGLFDKLLKFIDDIISNVL